VPFIYASSASVYGAGSVFREEPQYERPLNVYGFSKFLFDNLVRRRWSENTAQVVGLRYFNVYGRRQDPEGPYAAVIPRWIAALAAGTPCVIFGDGSQSRDFCYVDNAVQANLLAALGPADATGEVYNVGLEARTDLVQLFRMLRDRVAAFRPQAVTAEPEFAAPRPGDVQHSQASIAKIRQRLGYEATHSIEQGLSETVSWFLQRRSR
jgi:UDP-N-acetylglucosamine 4-epimerase